MPARKTTMAKANGSRKIKQRPARKNKKAYQRPFRFRDLLPELRNQIHSHLFQLHGDIILKQVRDSEEDMIAENAGIRLSPCFNLTPGILATCKAIHAEATPILYGKNTFTIQLVRLFPRFLSRIGESRKFIRRVRLYTGSDGHLKKTLPRCLDQMKEMKQLEKLELYDKGCLRGYLTLQWDFKTPKSLAQILGPLFRALHAAQRNDKQRKKQDVLDVLQFSGIKDED